MIQRIQTVYLLLSLACSVLLFFLPVWQAPEGYTGEGLDTIGATSYLFLLPVAGLLVISHLASIFLFKKRKRQKQFCTGNILLYLIFLLLSLVVLQLEHQIFQRFTLYRFQWGAALPFLGIIFNILARNGIRKDEALVRSMERLR